MQNAHLDEQLVIIMSGLAAKDSAVSSLYSSAVRNSATAQSGEIRRSYRQDLIGKVSLHGCLTLYETFNSSVFSFGNRYCLGERPVDSSGTPGLYIFQSYYEVAICVTQFASGLVTEKILECASYDEKHIDRSDERNSSINQREDNASDIVNVTQSLGLFLKNCSAWVIAEQACYSQSAVTIPLYETLGLESLSFIINQCGLQSILCSTKELNMIDLVIPLCPALKTIIIADSAEFKNIHRRDLISKHPRIR